MATTKTPRAEARAAQRAADMAAAAARVADTAAVAGTMPPIEDDPECAKTATILPTHREVAQQILTEFVTRGRGGRYNLGMVEEAYAKTIAQALGQLMATRNSSKLSSLKFFEGGYKQAYVKIETGAWVIRIASVVSR